MEKKESNLAPPKPNSAGKHNRRVSVLAKEWGVEIPRSSSQIVTGTEIKTNCPKCTHQFNIVDVGEEAEYTCPFCDHTFTA